MGKPVLNSAESEPLSEPTTNASFGKRDPKQFQDPAKDRRGSPRRRQYKAAKLIFNDNRSVIDCVLRDISGTGARVQLAEWMDCPEQVLLRLSDGMTFLSDVVWSRDNHMGLHFKEQVSLELSGTRSSAQKILAMAEALQVEILVRCLIAHHQFNDDEVRAAGEDLAQAHRRMIEALRGVLRRSERQLQERS